MANEISSVKNALSVLVVALVIALYLFANSTFFEAETIEWTGLNYLSPDQLEVFLDLPVTNVWRLDTRELAGVLMEHPWVVTAKAAWRWPNRVLVRVQERTPIAQIPTEGGWVLLDREGTLLPPTQAGVVYSVPIVTHLALDSQEQIVATARLLDMIPATLKQSISEWNAQNRSFVTRTGIEVCMGQPVDLEEKFVLLEKILDDLSLRNEQARRIDLSVPRSPVVSMAQ
ncbi:MAG: FtsQ-type POTRA domain-containing protein [Bacillota bacterium]|jgi:cell division protein FtsQ|nr:FtsQ-type POTRA domain-containing protein [Bacillota bacterium]HHT90273.1 FtsQ-type POTRA domain-containing protein [Bacillota bacterium]